MEISERNQRTKVRILDAAEGLFRRFTYLGLRMNQLSEHMGMSRKTLYNHFPGGKRDIWKGCIERRMEIFAGRLFSLVSDTGRDYVDRARDILDIGREALEVFNGPGGLISSNEEEQLFFPDLKKRYILALSAFLEEGASRGYLREDLPIRTLAGSFMVLISEWAKPENLLMDGELKSMPDFVEQVLFNGILSEEGRRNVYRLHGGKRR